MLHGRAAELGDIHELLANARVGHSSMLVLQGEAGSGKSALTGARRHRCEGLPDTALHGRRVRG